MRYVAAIARYTLLEAVRGRLAWLVLAAALVALALAGFLGQVAITETAAIQSSIMAAFARAGAVFLLTAFAVASTVREWNDKGVELVLSHPVPRWAFVAGRYAGFAAIGLAIAVAMSVPLALVAPLDRVAAWTFSLACELAIVAAATLFFALTLGNMVGALAAVLGFYVLARTIDVLRIIASANEGSGSLVDRIADAGVSAIAAVLPGFARMTQSDWLTDGVPEAALAIAIVQTLIYVPLLTAAAGFDFYRRNF